MKRRKKRRKKRFKNQQPVGDWCKRGRGQGEKKVKNKQVPKTMVDNTSGSETKEGEKETASFTNSFHIRGGGKKKGEERRCKISPTGGFLKKGFGNKKREGAGKGGGRVKNSMSRAELPGERRPRKGGKEVV